MTNSSEGFQNSHSRNETPKFDDQNDIKVDSFWTCKTSALINWTTRTLMYIIAELSRFWSERFI